MSVSLIVILIIFFGLCLLQWTEAIYRLNEGDYDTKKEFIIRMIPGYFFVSTFKFCCKIFSQFMLLD